MICENEFCIAHIYLLILAYPTQNLLPTMNDNLILYLSQLILPNPTTKTLTLPRTTVNTITNPTLHFT